MITSTELFELIKSLTPSEKRYFKRFSLIYSTSKKNNYLRLFEAVDQQKLYDEKAIVRKFGDEKFIKQLSVTKNYLYKLILRAMRSYSFMNDTESNEIADAKYLLQKSLFKGSAKLLHKSVSSAMEKEEYLTTLEALFTLRNLQGKPGIDYSGNACKEIYTNQLKTIEIYRNLCEYLFLEGYYKSILVKDARSVTKEEEKFFKDFKFNELLKSENQALSSKAKFLFYYINIHIHQQRGDYGKYYIYCKSLYKLIDGTILKDEFGLLDYSKYLRNYLSSAEIAGRYAEAEKLLKDLFELPNSNKLKPFNQISIYCYANYHKLKLYFLYYSCRFSEAESALGELKIFLQKYTSKINKEDLLEIYFISAVLCFINKNYDETLKWLNHYIDDNLFRKYRTDLFACSYSIRLLTHFELNNYDYIEYLISAFENFIKTVNDQYINNYKTVTYFFRKVLNSKDERDKNVYLSSMRNKMRNKEKMNIYRQRLFNYNFVLLWVDSKLEKKELAEIMKMKSDEIVKLSKAAEASA